MALDAKSFDSWWLSGLKIQKNSNWSFYHPGAWPENIKSFKFEVFEPQDLEFEAFNRIFPFKLFLKEIEINCCITKNSPILIILSVLTPLTLFTGKKNN